MSLSRCDTARSCGVARVFLVLRIFRILHCALFRLQRVLACWNMAAKPATGTRELNGTPKFRIARQQQPKPKTRGRSSRHLAPDAAVLFLYEKTVGKAPTYISLNAGHRQRRVTSRKRSKLATRTAG